MNRNTIQRSLVLEAVNKLHCHATADEIYREIIKTHPHISRATVYRNLNLLSDRGGDTQNEDTRRHRLLRPSSARPLPCEVREVWKDFRR